MGQIVLVWWEDCHSVDAWTSIPDLLQTYSPSVQTVGVFVGTNRSKEWVLVTGLGDFEPQAGGASWCIPPRMIRRWKRLRAKGGLHE